MRAAVLVAPGKLEVQDVPDLEIGPGEVLVRNTVSGICGSDLRDLFRIFQGINLRKERRCVRLVGGFEVEFPFEHRHRVLGRVIGELDRHALLFGQRLFNRLL